MGMQVACCWEDDRTAMTSLLFMMSSPQRDLERDKFVEFTAGTGHLGGVKASPLWRSSVVAR